MIYKLFFDFNEVKNKMTYKITYFSAQIQV